MADTIVDLRMSRRGLIKLGGAAAVATTGAAGAMWPIEAQLKELEHQGWSRHPLACCMCGAFCGLVAMKKIGEPTSEKTVRIFPNPDHPPARLLRPRRRHDVDLEPSAAHQEAAQARGRTR